MSATTSTRTLAGFFKASTNYLKETTASLGPIQTASPLGTSRRSVIEPGPPPRPRGPLSSPLAAASETVRPNPEKDACPGLSGTPAGIRPL